MSLAKRTNWLGTWSTYKIGATDEIFPDLKFVLEPIHVGSIGAKTPIGDRFIALQGMVKVQFREIDIALFHAMNPWADPASGSISLTPPQNSDLYDYAELLTLHPTDLPAGDNSEDLNLVKTTPMTALNIKKAGAADDLWEVEFKVYPERDKLLTGVLFYGCIGPVPT